LESLAAVSASFIAYPPGFEFTDPIKETSRKYALLHRAEREIQIDHPYK
jgi:hypothetical protein